MKTEQQRSEIKVAATALRFFCLSVMLLLAVTTMAGEWKTHEVRQVNGPADDVRLPAQFQIVTECWNRAVAVPSLAYLPEKDRPLLLVNCDYPPRAEALFSDNRGASWSSPKPANVDADGKPLAGLGTGLPRRLQKPRSILVSRDNFLPPIPAIFHS